MKSLKLDHSLAQAVADGTKNSTIRLFDDKDLTVNDQVELIDKVDPRDRNSWVPLGTVTIKQVVQKRVGEITVKDLREHGLYDSTEAMLTELQRYYGPGISLETPAKIITFSYGADVLAQVENPIMTGSRAIKLYTDGGSRGNPGPSASGYVLLDLHDNVVKKSGVYLGITTNNQAEYQALKFGLEEAQKLGVHEVQVFMDSMLVVNQMKGTFKVKNRDLWPIHEAIKELASTFKKVTFQHIPRELNKLADHEVNETLDANTHKSGV
jgi:ribonuclease HI